MLPWIFGVLALLNLALFLWGYQIEPPAEPNLTPVPAGRYEIRLRSEADEGVSEPPGGIAAPPGGSVAGGAAAPMTPPAPTDAAAVDPANPPEADAIVLEVEPPGGAGAEPEPESEPFRGEGASEPVSQGASADGPGKPAPGEPGAKALPDL